MSPRKNRKSRSERRPADAGLDDDRVRRGIGFTQTWSDGDWTLRQITGEAAVKTYRCPGCDQEIPPGTPHLVAWPADERGDLSDRRHWHAGCWKARDRRAPNIQRGARGQDKR